MFTKKSFKEYANETVLETVKEAGFQGILFDIEATDGEEELVKAMEKAFAACKRVGLLVMVTTSHTAPFNAASDSSRKLLIASWVNSSDIDVFSPLQIIDDLL